MEKSRSRNRYRTREFFLIELHHVQYTLNIITNEETLELLFYSSLKKTVIAPFLNPTLEVDSLDFILFKSPSNKTNVTIYLFI